MLSLRKPNCEATSLSVQLLPLCTTTIIITACRSWEYDHGRGVHVDTMVPPQELNNNVSLL